MSTSTNINDSLLSIPTPFRPKLAPHSSVEATLGVIADTQFAPRPNQFNYAKTHERCYHQALSILENTSHFFNRLSQSPTDLLPVNPGVMFREECVTCQDPTTSHEGLCLRTYHSETELEALSALFQGEHNASQRLSYLDRLAFPQSQINHVIQLGDFIDGSNATMADDRITFGTTAHHHPFSTQLDPQTGGEIVTMAPRDPKEYNPAPHPLIISSTYYELLKLHFSLSQQFLLYSLAEIDLVHASKTTQKSEQQNEQLFTDQHLYHYFAHIRAATIPSTIHGFLRSTFPHLSSHQQLSTQLMTFILSPPTLSTAAALCAVFGAIEASSATYWHHLIGNHDAMCLPRGLLPYVYTTSGNLTDSLIVKQIKEFRDLDEIDQITLAKQIDAKITTLQSQLDELYTVMDTFISSQHAEANVSSDTSTPKHYDIARIIEILKQKNLYIPPETLPTLRMNDNTTVTNRSLYETLNTPHIVPGKNTLFDPYSYTHCYHSSISENYHLVVLDAYSSATTGLPGAHSSFLASLNEHLCRFNPNFTDIPHVDEFSAKYADMPNITSLNWATGLNHDNKKYVPYNGALQYPQLQWLEHVLLHEIPHHKRVILASHVATLPEHATGSTALFDGDKLISILRQIPGKVCMFLSGHDHSGHYVYDNDSKTHFITIAAPIEASHGDVFGKSEEEIAKLEEDRLKGDPYHSSLLAHRCASRALVYHQSKTLTALNNGIHPYVFGGRAGEVNSLEPYDGSNEEWDPLPAPAHYSNRPYNNQHIHAASVIQLHKDECQIIGLGSVTSRYLRFAAPDVAKLQAYAQSKM